MSAAVQKASGAYVVVRIRGTVNITGKIQDTMRMLRVAAPNHCSIVPITDSNKGMVQKCQDYVAYGEADAATVAELLRTRGKMTGDKPVTDADIQKATEGKYAGIEAFAAALAKGDAKLTDLGEDFKPLFRLSPPKGGHGTIKHHASTGGPLGYHGKAVNELVKRMI